MLGALRTFSAFSLRSLHISQEDFDKQLLLIIGELPSLNDGSIELFIGSNSMRNILVHGVDGVLRGINDLHDPAFSRSSPSQRENMMSFRHAILGNVLFIGIGITVAYWIDFGMSYTKGSIAWRLPIALQIILAITVIILLFGLPESPRWLCKRGREAEAIEVMCQTFDLMPEDEYIKSEMRNIRHAIEIETKAGAQSLMSLFRADELKTRRRVILAYVGLFMNQLSGINLVVYYMPCLSPLPSNDRYLLLLSGSGHECRDGCNAGPACGWIVSQTANGAFRKAS
ncbi:MAG: hypothetical protein Q9160_002861 [Pyrenula sp. 1 TL-2023]